MKSQMLLFTVFAVMCVIGIALKSFASSQVVSIFPMALRKNTSSTGSQLCIGIDPYRWLQLGDTFYVDPPQVPLNRIWKYNIPEVRIFSALLSHPSRTKDVEKAAFFFRGPISQFSFVSTCPDELYRYGQSPPLNTVTIAPNDDMEDLCGWNEYAIWRASMSSVYSPRCHISVGDPTHSFNLGPPYMGNRPLKACFKGQRYPGADSPFSDVRGQLYQLFHGSTDIVVRTKCHAYYYDKLADATEKSQCDSQALEYDARPGEYEVFMQSCKFSLVPRGRGLHSYRLIESMAWGAIPVIVADTYVLPFADIIDWSQFSVVVEEKDIAKLPAILRNYSDTQLDVMRERAWKAYQKHFQSAAVWVDTGFKQLLYRVNETLQSMSPS